MRFSRLKFDEICFPNLYRFLQKRLHRNSASRAIMILAHRWLSRRLRFFTYLTYFKSLRERERERFKFREPSLLFEVESSLRTTSSIFFSIFEPLPLSGRVHCANLNIRNCRDPSCKKSGTDDSQQKSIQNFIHKIRH